jgi:hypothetical protein
VPVAAPTLFDHLVGAGKNQGRDRQAERLRGLDIDDEVEFYDLLDRQVGRIGAFKNFAG